MTQEDKKLLLVDISARLPYEVKGVITFNGDKDIFTLKGISKKLLFESAILFLSDAECCHVEDFKPYLRPMSSMTEEEEKEFNKVVYDSTDIDYISPCVCVANWMYSKYFDVNGLIPKGLAIEAPEGMYK